MTKKIDGILLIEDEVDLAEVLCFIFEDLGIKIEVALSAEEAKKKIRRMFL